MRPTLEYSSAYGRGLTVATAVAGAAAVVVTVVDLGAEAGLAALVWAVLVVLLVWAVFWRPAVVVSDGEVVVRNVWRTTRVPWPTFRGVDAGLSLVVRHTRGSVTAWAAPGSSATAAHLRRPRPGAAPADRAQPPAADRWPGARTDRPAVDGRAGAAGDLDARPVRLSGTAPSVAAAIRERHDALVGAGHLRGAEDAVAGGIRPAVTWHARTLGATVAALVAAAAVTLG